MLLGASAPAGSFVLPDLFCKKRFSENILKNNNTYDIISIFQILIGILHNSQVLFWLFISKIKINIFILNKQVATINFILYIVSYIFKIYDTILNLKIQENLHTITAIRGVDYVFTE